eukprot:45257_1
MSEEEQPLKAQQQQPEVKNEEVKNEESGRVTTIDRDALEQGGDKWETETKFARFWSITLYVTLMAFDFLGAVSIIIYLLQVGIWDSWINQIIYLILMLMGIGMVFYGLISLFRYGGTSRLIQNLAALSELIASQASQLALQTDSLENAVDALSFETKRAKMRENNLNEIVGIGEEIGRLGMKINVDNVDVSAFFNDITLVQKAVGMIKRQIVKNEMMIKFYEYEMNDDIEGLNKNEYELFINSLDKQTADTWRDIGLSWKNLKGNDNIIDAVEFESGLDKLFNALDRIDARTVKEFNRRQKAIF